MNDDSSKSEKQSDAASGVDVERRVRQILVNALQEAWDDHCADTGCYPDFLEIKKGKATANFELGNFANYVAELLIEKKTSPPPDIADKLARKVFALGDEHPELGGQTQRIEFKGGQYPNNERAMGGLCETSLASFLRKELASL